MDYSRLCEVYQELESTTKGLEKTKIISNFLENIKNYPEYIYLLQGNVFADYDKRELGISIQLAIRSISQATGVLDSDVVKEFKKLGDLGSAVEELIKKKKQQTSLFSKKLTIDKVLSNLRKLPTFEGKGTINQKLGLIVDLLHSATSNEAKFILRTVLGDLKVGVGSGLLRDAIADFCFKPKDIKEKKEATEKIQEAYDKTTDFAEVFPKAHDIKDAFRIVGCPAAFEYKYDGFRAMINKDLSGKIKIFTRRLEEVTDQFPDIIEYVKKNIKAKSFIIDAEAVGYDFSTKKYTPFQTISQRIKRKYGIHEMARKYPIELTVFDIIYYENKNLIEEPFKKRRKLIEKIIREEPFKIILAKQIITEDEKKVEEFYNEALSKNQEGLMAKNLDSPYKPGARIGYAVKLKPEDNEFDLVITGAEWGTGKRAGWLTSFDISCLDEDELKEVGKVSTGLKELKEEGLSFVEMTEKLNDLIIEEHGKKVEVRPEIVVSVAYQNIQKSPTYSSGYALRFPRIKTLRPDRSKEDIARLKEIKKEAGS